MAKVLRRLSPGRPAGYGLRRMLIDEQGQPKGEFKRGEHKSLQTDRVILIPGPQDEIATVRWIYRSFVEDGLNEGAIADQLNQRGVLADLDRSWTRGTVHQVLTNEKYIGNNVFNRTSFKLKKLRVVNEPEMWVRADAVFEAIVDTRHYYTAQGIIRERGRRFTDDEILAKLRTLQATGVVKRRDRGRSCTRCRSSMVVERRRTCSEPPGWRSYRQPTLSHRGFALRLLRPAGAVENKSSL